MLRCFPLKLFVFSGETRGLKGRERGGDGRERGGEGRERGCEFLVKTAWFALFLRSIIFCASVLCSSSCLNGASCSTHPYLSAPKRIYENDEFWPTNDPNEKRWPNFDLTPELRCSLSSLCPRSMSNIFSKFARVAKGFLIRRPAGISTRHQAPQTVEIRQRYHPE